MQEGLVACKTVTDESLLVFLRSITLLSGGDLSGKKEILIPPHPEITDTVFGVPENIICIVKLPSINPVIGGPIAVIFTTVKVLLFIRLNNIKIDGTI